MPYLGVKPADITSAAEAEVAGDLTVDTNTLKVDATNNRVFVGATSGDRKFEVHDTGVVVANFKSTGANSLMAFDNSSATSQNHMIGFSGYDFRVVETTEKIRVLSSGGITFNGDTAAANPLDDYEEGTYTPAISATDGIGTLTYSAQVGRYTKVGNRVSFNAYVSIANKGTVAGSLRITLPFTVKNVANNNTVFSWWINSAVSGQRFDGDTMQFCFASPNSYIALPCGSNGSGGVDLLNAAHVQNGTDMMVGGTYEV